MRIHIYRRKGETSYIAVAAAEPTLGYAPPVHLHPARGHAFTTIPHRLLCGGHGSNVQSEPLTSASAALKAKQKLPGIAGRWPNVDGCPAEAARHRSGITGAAVNRWSQAAAAFALLLSSLSCGDSSGPSVGTTPTKIMLVSAVNPTGYGVATRIPTPVVIRVTDHRGLPVPNVKVWFTPDKGSVTPTFVMSDGEGKAVTQWTVSALAGTNTLVVSAPDVPSIAPLAITTTTVPGPIAGVVINPPAATIPQGNALHLDGYGADRYGNRVNGTPISWSSSDPSVATVSAGLLTTTGPGVALISATYTAFTATMLVSVPVPTGPGGAGIPSFSIATSVDDDYGITVVRSDGTVESRITCGTACEYLTRPNWSRDGSKLSLTGKRGDLSILFVANRDGSDLHEVASTPKLRILTSKGSFDHWPQFHEDWSAADQLVYVRKRTSATSIETVHADGTGRKTIMTTAGVVEPGTLLALVDTRWGLGDVMITARIDTQLTAMNADGTNARPLAPIGFDEHVWSPDGGTIAVIKPQGNQSTLSLIEPLTAASRSMILPNTGTFCWAPNSSGFAFISPENQTAVHTYPPGWWKSIYVINRDGSGLRKVVPVMLGDPLPGLGWSPDGKFVVYEDDRASTGGTNGAQLYAQSVDQGTNTRLSDIANVNYFSVAGSHCTRDVH